jgi:opacity protein-like surface antigen
MTEQRRLSTLRRLACALLVLAGSPAQAQAQAEAFEATWSGFASLGYARSDSPYTYQRFINEDGTFKRDSLVAGQVDLRLNSQWSATAQAKLAPARTNDSGLDANATWAFVAWRPDNDWLLRAGKMRLPLYLHSESLDVGVATDMARLPHEVYSIAPTNDVKGLFITRSFALGEHDISLDAYSGRTNVDARLWTRDGAPPFVPAGAYFKTVTVNVSGLLVTGRDPSLNWRLAVHSTKTRSADGMRIPVRFARVEVGPGMGYWKVSDQQPGPPMETAASIRNLAFTGGAEWQIDPSWRLAGEFVRMQQRDTEVGSDSKAGYVAVFKRFGAFTPYVSLARKRSSDRILEWYRRLMQEQLPSFIPGAAQSNAAQRISAESLYAFDQRSWALGASYALSPTAKIKAEWMRTQVGATSADFNAPLGQPDPQNLRVNTLTINVSVAF